MECKNCLDEMKLINKWGDGYIEPYEYKYACPSCEATYWHSQEGYEEWTGIGEED